MRIFGNFRFRFKILSSKQKYLSEVLVNCSINLELLETIYIL